MRPWNPTILCAVLTLGSSPVYPFAIDGLRSGMTAADVQSSVERRGLEFWRQDEVNAFMGRRSDFRVDAGLSICDGRLVRFSKSIDQDADYLNVLREALGEYGQPKVALEQLPWSGPGGGYIRSMVLVWYSSGDKISLSMTPEGRTGKGELRHFRGANLTHEVKNRCIRDF